MSTVTLTETEQRKTETRSVIIKSSEHIKAEHNSNSNTVIKDTQMKKNKNACLRKSKSALSCENADPDKNEPQDKDHDATERKVLRTEKDGDEDSAVGSSIYSELSLDSLLSNEVDDLKLDDTGETMPTVSVASTGAEGWSPPLNSGPTPPVFCTPKLAVPTSYSPQVYEKKKVIFRRDKIQPVQGNPELNAFGMKQPNTDTLHQPEIDGDISQQVVSSAYQVKSELDEEVKPELDDVPLSPCCSLTVSSLSSWSRGGMSDFVILHTDDDLEAAGNFMDHLLKDIGIPDLTVDLLSNIDAGKPGMQSLGTLHDKYRYILTFVTKNLESDKYCRYLDEILLTLGLREANGKENRVVPVLTQNGYCKIIELSILSGLQYFRFHLTSSLKESYIDSVKRLVEAGRKKFP